MSRRLDITGQRFGQLTALYCKEEKSNNGDFIWICKCDCGNLTESPVGRLRCGKKIRCKQCYVPSKLTHGMAGTPAHRTWLKMLARCKPDSDYHDYTSKGIKVCDRWLHSFENFYEDMGDRPEGMSLDRIDVYGDYTPENCRWAGATEQVYNQTKRSNNTSGRTGVRFREERGKWEARIGHYGKKVILGMFETFEEAVATREKAELELYGYNKQ